MSLGGPTESSAGRTDKPTLEHQSGGMSPLGRPPYDVPVMPAQPTQPRRGTRKSTKLLLAFGTVALLAAIAGIVVVAANGPSDNVNNASRDHAARDGDRTTVTGSLDEAAPQASTAPPTVAPSSVDTIVTLPLPTVPATAPETVPLQVIGVSGPSAPSGIDACNRTQFYDPQNVLDGDSSSAWRVVGSGVGSALSFRLAGPAHITQLGLIPGFTKIDPCDGVNRFPQNRRVTSVTWSLGGQTYTQSLMDSPTMQTIPVDAVASEVTLRITGDTGEAMRDFTAITEVAIR